MTALIDHVAGETVKTKGQRKNMQGERYVGDQGGEFTSTLVA